MDGPFFSSPAENLFGPTREESDILLRLSQVSLVIFSLEAPCRGGRRVGLALWREKEGRQKKGERERERERGSLKTEPPAEGSVSGGGR